MCDIHTNGNVFLGFTVWDVHTFGNDFWDSPFGMYIPTEMISRIHRVGCTYLRKWFLGFTVWDVHTYGNDWVSMPRPIAHGPSLGPTRAYPRRFLGRVGRTPLSPTLTWRWFQMPLRKGVKTVCSGPTCTSDLSVVGLCVYSEWCMNYLIIVWHGDCKPTIYSILVLVHGIVWRWPFLRQNQNLVMPLSHASIHGRYSRILGVTSW